MSVSLPFSASTRRSLTHTTGRARTFVEVEGVPQPAPAPRFSRTTVAVQGPPPKAGEHTDAVLADWGFSDQQINAMRSAGAI